MALTFIAGPSGCGKTTALHKRLLKEAEKNLNRNYIILVPEQFNLQTQLDILHKSSKKGIWNVDVLSFARLAHRIFDEAGGNDRRLLDDTAKTMILRRLGSMQEDSLKVIAGKMDKAGYINEVKSVISEFLQYDVKPEDIDEWIGFYANRRELGAKLEDIKLLYIEFEKFLREKYITGETLLDRAIELADKAAFLKNASLYLDGYTGFTPVQIKFLEHLMRYCEDVEVTVTIGREKLAEVSAYLSVGYAGGERMQVDSEGLFGLGEQTISLLCNVAGRQKIELYIPNRGESMRLQNSSALAHIEKWLFRQELLGESSENRQCEAKDAIHITELSDVRSEAHYICRQIRELVQKKGYRYSDIAVLAGGLEEYENPIENEMEKYEIPYFIDVRRPVMQNPVVNLIMSALLLITEGFSYESVFRYLRCGMSEFSKEEIDELDNYVTAAGIRKRSDYKKEWTYRPRGYEIGKKQGASSETDRLVWLNDIRVRFLENTDFLCENFYPKKKQKGEKLVKALYQFLKKNDIYKKLNERAAAFKEQQDAVRAKEYETLYEAIIKLLDRFMEILAGEALSTEEFADILKAGLSELSAGVLPQGVDQVLVGDIERSRLSEIKVLFLAGVNDGVIPKDVHKRGLLSELDRERLKQLNARLAPGTREQAFIQKFYLYMYLTKPSQKLFLSFCDRDVSGNTILQSYLINEVLGLFNDLRIEQVECELKDINSALTIKEGFDILTRELFMPEGESYSRWFSYYASRDDYREELKKIVAAVFRVHTDDPLSEIVVKALYGEKISGSVTRLESFARCAYRHFLQYGLKLYEKQEYSFEVRDFGTLCHDALENFGMLMHKNNYSWLKVEADVASALMKEAVDLTLNKNEDTVLFSSSRTAFIEHRIRRILDRTVKTIIYQLQKGDFEPESFERKLYEKIQIPDTEIDMTFSGSIDRVDICRDGKNIYVKVTDYKSSDRTLQLTDIYEGLSLQLMTYVYCAIGQIKKENRDALVHNGGVFYYKLDDPLLNYDKVGESEDTLPLLYKELCPNGFINNDIIEHYDRTIEDKSDVVPVTINKKSGTIKKGTGGFSETELDEIAEFAFRRLKNLAQRMYEGEVCVKPAKTEKKGEAPEGCAFCRYGHICGFDANKEGYSAHQIEKKDNEQVLAEMILVNNGSADLS